MRVTQNVIYSQAIRSMNSALSEQLELNMQMSSQKKVNKPSDDPAGTATILSLRSELTSIGYYEENISTAESWLSLADAELSQASTIVNRLMELAEQGASGTYTDDEREIIADEVRQLYGELLNVANTEYAGQSIFAGQKVDQNAYEERLWATVLDENIPDGAVISVEGESSYSIAVEFLGDGEVGTDELAYRYSLDGGKTWTGKTLAAGDSELDLGGVRMALAPGTDVSAPTVDAPGSSFIVRPSLVYLGDDEDGAEVAVSGAPGIAAEAQGHFGSRTLVRVDADATLPGPLAYSWSTDGGATWVEGNTAADGRLSLPGGFLELTPDGGALPAGAEITVTPNEAAIELSITASSSIQVNNVGKDVFGGLYADPETGQLTPAPGVGDEENLFESVGRLVGYLETDNQDGVAQCLEDLENSLTHMLGVAGDVGARLNRLSYTENAMVAQNASVTAQISQIEDADVTTLTTELARADYVYQAVLQTSSQIMGLSLLNYL